MIQLNEGGSAVGGERIKKENIQPTVARFNKEVLRVISPHKWGLVGSTGKKPENGDVDIGIETQLSFKEISEILSSLNLHHVVNTGLGEISVAFPQYDSQGNQLPDIVQIDLMIGDFAWIDFIYTGFSPQETKYKPLARTAVLYGLLRYSSEKQDGDIITFYSISPNRGAFLKQGKKVVNKKGVKELKSDRVGEYIQDPHFIVETISEGTRHTWTLEELRYPFEELWPLVKDRCPEEMVEKISKYAKNFLENIKIPVPEELINIESLMEAAKTAHLTHIEDKLYDEGKMGGEKILMYLESLFDELKGNTPKNKVRATLKVDGSPAVCISNNYPGINKPFVGTKNTFAKPPQIYSTEEEIYAKYGDIPDLAEKLKAALRLAPQLGIPDGEIWKGDFLFTKKDLVIEEMDGEQFVIFQPNTLIYAVPTNSEIGQKILSSDIGIAFHTKYTGDDLRTAEGTADFDVNVSTLTPPPNAFIIDANLPSIAGSGTMTGEETKAVEELLVHAKQLFGSIPEDFFNTLMTDPIYTPLLNMYENYMVRLASGQTTQFGEDVHAYLMKFTDWISDRYAKEADTKKTEKGKQQALARGEAIVSFVDQNVSKFISLFELQNTIVKIKNYLLRKMEQVSKLIPLKREPDGKLKITNNEGFAVSDVNGDIIKVVDRLGFSQANLLRNREAYIEESDEIKKLINLSERGSLPDLPKAVSTFIIKHNLDPDTIKKLGPETPGGNNRVEIKSKEKKPREIVAREIEKKEKDLELTWKKKPDKSRPTLYLPSFGNFEIQLKDVPGVATDKRSVATANTELHETATAYALYSVIEKGYEPTLEELKEIDPECDKHWYASALKSAKGFKTWLKSRKGYSYSRELSVFPPGSIALHSLIKKTAKKLGYRKPDSWNPSDLYACKKEFEQTAYDFFSSIPDYHESSKKVGSAASQEIIAQNREKVNEFLENALIKKNLIGISLKKITQQSLAEKIIPESEIFVDAFPLSLTVDTLTLALHGTSGKQYSLSIRTGQTDIKTVVLEFRDIAESSQLGKATDSVHVEEMFERYGLKKPSKFDWYGWAKLDSETIKTFKAYAKRIRETFPGVRYSLADIPLYFKTIKEPGYSLKHGAAIFQKFQQLLYGELMVRAKENDELEDVLALWMTAARKLEYGVHAPYVVIHNLH